MKKYFVLSLVLTTMFFASCSHDSVYDTEAGKKMTDLEVPKDFDWNTSEDVSLTLTSPVQTSVAVFADETCKVLLANLPIGPEETTYNVSTEKGAEKLYVQYTKADNSKAVLPLAITTVPTRANGHGEGEVINGAVGNLPEDQGDIKLDQDGEYTCYYPSDGWGTLLFEDMWPEIGDYDFNDVSAYYKIQLHELTNGQRKTQLIRVALRLNALGGQLPYHLRLQTLGIQASEIESIEPEFGDAHVYQLENPGENEPAIFSFNWKDKKGSNGGSYYNVEREYLLPATSLAANEISFLINLTKEKNIKNKLKHEAFDFYIQKDDSYKTEIHLRGYKPTKAFHARYMEICKENPNLSQTYYCTEDNWVWGMKVNHGVAHAIERVDFTKAYTDFAAWLQSAGRESTNWYLSSKVHNNCVEVD